MQISLTMITAVTAENNFHHHVITGKLKVKSLIFSYIITFCSLFVYHVKFCQEFNTKQKIHCFHNTRWKKSKCQIKGKWHSIVRIYFRKRKKGVDLANRQISVNRDGEKSYVVLYAMQTTETSTTGYIG